MEIAVVGTGYVGLVAGVTIVRFDFTGDSLKDKAVNLLVMEAVFNARLYARENREPTHLSYDLDKQELVITTAQGAAIEKINCRYDGQEEPQIHFHPLLSSDYNGGGSFDYEYALEPVPYVFFGPSGVSTPVSVKIESDHFNDTLYLDAFATMLLPEDYR